MTKKPKQKLLSIIVIVVLLGMLGFLAYNYRDLFSSADVVDAPTLPSPDTLGSADIIPFSTTGWNLVAYPFKTTIAEKDGNGDPTDKSKYLTSRLVSATNDTGKDLVTELSQIYEPIFRLQKSDTAYVAFNKTTPNYNTQPGLGYWIYLGETDDKTPPDTLLDDYSTIINQSLKVNINTNSYTLIGNPYAEAVELSSIKFSGIKVNTNLGSAVDDNLAIVYTYDNDNFGDEFVRLTGSDSLEPNEGAAIITKVKEASVVFNKP